MSEERKIRWIEDNPFESCGETIIVSEQHVMHSSAGFYIGRMCKTVGGKLDGFTEPYNRGTDYMTEEEANELFQALNE